MDKNTIAKLREEIEVCRNTIDKTISALSEKLAAVEHRLDQDATCESSLIRHAKYTWAAGKGPMRCGHIPFTVLERVYGIVSSDDFMKIRDHMLKTIPRTDISCAAMQLLRQSECSGSDSYRYMAVLYDCGDIIITKTSESTETHFRITFDVTGSGVSAYCTEISQDDKSYLFEPERPTIEQLDLLENGGMKYYDSMESALHSITDTMIFPDIIEFAAPMRSVIVYRGFIEGNFHEISVVGTSRGAHLEICRNKMSNLALTDHSYKMRALIKYESGEYHVYSTVETQYETQRLI